MSASASATKPETGTRANERSKAGAKLAANLLALVLLGVLAGVGTWSAFSALTANSGNSFESGTVDLGDDDDGSAMFGLTGLKPGDSATKCIVVDYSGSLSAGVKLYGSTGGTGLDQYLTVKVTRGTKSNAFSSCTDFAADSRDYIGAGQGVVYNGTLADYPDTHTAGLDDPADGGGNETWANPESHAYKLEVTLPSSTPNAAEGKTATQQFTWEARNN